MTILVVVGITLFPTMIIDSRSRRMNNERCNCTSSGEDWPKVQRAGSFEMEMKGKIGALRAIKTFWGKARKTSSSTLESRCYAWGLAEIIDRYLQNYRIVWLLVVWVIVIVPGMDWTGGLILDMTSKSFEWRKKWKPSCCLRVRPGFAAYLEVVCNMCLSWIVRVRPGFAAYLEGVVWRSWRSSSITILTHGSLPLSMQATCLWKKMNTTDECTLPHHDFISQMKECKLYKSTRKSSFLWFFWCLTRVRVYLCVISAGHAVLE